MLSPDLVRRVVRLLPLWDARSLQTAHPLFAALVAEHVGRVVDEALRRPRPRLVDTFLRSAPGFRECVHGSFVFLRTKRTVTMQHTEGDVTVHMRLSGRHATIEVRCLATATWPTFDTLAATLAAMRWFAEALRDRGGVRKVCFRTSAAMHRPVTEVLNGVATRFAERFATGLFEHAEVI